jgi:hypothetical protein
MTVRGILSYVRIKENLASISISILEIHHISPDSCKLNPIVHLSPSHSSTVPVIAPTLHPQKSDPNAGPLPLFLHERLMHGQQVASKAGVLGVPL